MRPPVVFLAGPTVALVLMAATRFGRDSDNVILWPRYFDAKESRITGRRVPRKMAVKSPKVEEILEIAREAGYKIYVEPDKAHPSEWGSRGGRLVVEKRKPKTLIIRDIAARLKVHRSESQEEQEP